MGTQPSGTVTFLFTDLEGSTRLWETQTDSMSAALRTHDEIVRGCIEESGGHVFKTVGDAFCASFVGAPDAARAALKIQQRIRAVKWALSVPLRIRVALHSGKAEIRDNDYFGPPVNRCARLLAVAAGGQTIMSLVTMELACDSLPSGASIRDLGSCRLKDLARPEKIFELRPDEISDVFPPLKGLDSHPNNLPLQLTALVGREWDLKELEKLIIERQVRLLTLVGPGGIGKTRLSLQVAADLMDRFPDGAYVVDLASVRDARDVPRAILQTLRIPDTPETLGIKRLSEWIDDRRMILVLDNVEQVIDCAADLAGLVAECPRVSLIVTSREALRVRGEYAYRVPPLALPEHHHGRLDEAEMIGRFESVRLFIQRARSANPNFELSKENAHAVAEICVQLDGLPLALEIAASRLSILSAESLLKLLGKGLKALTGGARDLPERQRTLAGAISWSYGLLDEKERVVFRVLSLFSGSFTLGACEALCDDLALEKSEIVRIVEALVDKSLCVVVPQAAGESRLKLLKTIREFGLLQLGEGAEKEKLRSSHARYYMTLAESARGALEGPHQKEHFETFDWELENIRAACLYHEDRRDFQSVVRLVTALGPYWQVRGYFTETRKRLENAASQGSDLPGDVSSLALLWTGIMAMEQRDCAAAQESLGRAVDTARATGNRLLETLSLEASSSNLRRLRRLADARNLAEQALTLAKSIHDEFFRARCEFDIALCDLWADKLEGVRERVEAASAFFHAGGYLKWEAIALNISGVLASYDRDFETASGLYERASTTWGISI
jgi:predicted ATPase/class 3 adenylate cyclase